MGEEAKLRVVLDAENKGREEVEQFEAGLKGVGEQAEQTHKELGKAFDVDALVEDAVLGLEVANDAFDDQAAIVNRLAKAQHDLEAKALRLADAQLALAENTDPKAQHELEAAVLDARVALDEQTKSVDKLAREYVGLDDHTTKATSGFDDLSNVFEGLTGMSLSTTLSIAGLVMVLKEGLEIAGASTERYLEYTEQVRGLSDAYSLSARQASTLVQVLDDARVKPASVETAFRKMAENGIQPSIENLADLSERFESIRNPIEKAAFLSDQFGQRAGPEMAKLLALGKTSILEYAEAARDANLTLTAADLAAAERLKAARDELADAQTRLDITVGPLLANLSTAFTWVATEVLRGFGVAVEQDVRPSLAVLQEDVVDISGAYEEMSAIGQAAFDGMLGPIDAVAAAQAAAEEAQKRLNKELGDLQMLLAGGVGKENKRHAETMGDLTERAEELRGEMDKLTASNGQYYEYTTDSSMSANELALAQYNLAEAQAELSKETDPGKQLELAVKVEHLQEKVSGATTVVSGYIDNSKKIGELSAEYDEVTAAIDRENAAHVANTRSFMFNLIMKRAAMDDFKTYSLGDLGALAARWGLLDEDTAKTMGIVDEALTAGKGDVEVAADYIDARVQTSADGVRVAMSDEAHDLETAKVRSSVLTGLITQYAHDTKTDVGEDTDAIETDVTGARSGVSSATAIMDADMARSMGMAETLVSVLQQEIDGKEYHNYVITHFQASYEGGIGDVEVTGDYQGGTTPNMRRKKQDATQINGEVTGFAAGGSFIVPGRGRGDRPYTIPLEPGEHVQITPVDDVRRGGGSGADRAGAQIVVLVLNDQDKERLAYEMANIYAGRA